MRWPKITEADLNSFVDHELGAYDLVRVMVHLLCDHGATTRVAAYARQRRTLAALRAELDAYPSDQRLKDLEDELCRLMRS